MHTRTLLIAAALALAGGLWWYAHAGAQEPPRASDGERLGFIDLRAVLDAYPERGRSEQQLAQWYKERKKQIDQLSERSGEKYNAARQYEFGSTRYEQLVIEARELDIKYQVQKKLLPQEHQEQWKKEFKRLYAAILRATEDVARRKGFTVVLKIDTPESISPAELGAVELTAEIKFRGVLYYQPANDITQDVIAELNR